MAAHPALNDSAGQRPLAPRVAHPNAPPGPRGPALTYCTAGTPPVTRASPSLSREPEVPLHPTQAWRAPTSCQTPCRHSGASVGTACSGCSARSGSRRWCNRSPHTGPACTSNTWAQSAGHGYEHLTLIKMPPPVTELWSPSRGQHRAMGVRFQVNAENPPAGGLVLVPLSFLFGCAVQFVGSCVARGSCSLTRDRKQAPRIGSMEF